MSATKPVIFIHDHTTQGGQTYRPDKARTVRNINASEARLAVHLGHAVLADADAPTRRPSGRRKRSTTSTSAKSSSKSTQSTTPTESVDKTKEQGR